MNRDGRTPALEKLLPPRRAAAALDGVERVNVSTPGLLCASTHSYLKVAGLGRTAALYPDPNRNDHTGLLSEDLSNICSSDFNGQLKHMGEPNILDPLPRSMSLPDETREESCEIVGCSQRSLPREKNQGAKIDAGELTILIGRQDQTTQMSLISSESLVFPTQDDPSVHGPSAIEMLVCYPEPSSDQTPPAVQHVPHSRSYGHISGVPQSINKTEREEISRDSQSHVCDESTCFSGTIATGNDQPDYIQKDGNFTTPDLIISKDQCIVGSSLSFLGTEWPKAVYESPYSPKQRELSSKQDLYPAVSVSAQHVPPLGPTPSLIGAYSKLPPAMLPAQFIQDINKTDLSGQQDAALDFRGSFHQYQNKQQNKLDTLPSTGRDCPHPPSIIASPQVQSTQQPTHQVDSTQQNTHSTDMSSISEQHMHDLDLMAIHAQGKVRRSTRLATKGIDISHEMVIPKLSTVRPKQAPDLAVTPIKKAVKSLKRKNLGKHSLKNKSPRKKPNLDIKSQEENLETRDHEESHDRQDVDFVPVEPQEEDVEITEYEDHRDDQDVDFEPVEFQEEDVGITEHENQDNQDVDFELDESMQEDVAAPFATSSLATDTLLSTQELTVQSKTTKKRTKSTVVKTETRPLCCGTPLVWAEGRQALCEALPWYRAYQCAAYTNHDVCYGFLLDKAPGTRGYMDEEVVITRSGGGCTKDENGEMKQTQDQSPISFRNRCYINNKQNLIPVGLIVGQLNENCPSVIPHRYCVMDWFHVTNIWAEKSNHKIVYYMRFEKIDRATPSWWSPEGSPKTYVNHGYVTKAMRKVCDTCEQESIQVFELGWVCLDERCTNFWKLGDRELTDKDMMTHNPFFLNERNQWPAYIKPPYVLKPAPLAADSGEDPGFAVSRVCWKGVVCPACGRCNSRALWDAWSCETEGCSFKLKMHKSVLSPRSVFNGHHVPYDGHALPLDLHDGLLTTRPPQFSGNWRVHTYDLHPGNFATHFFSNNVINRKPGGPDELFKKFQELDLGLQRFPMESSQVQGKCLSQHFAINYGMPYKYAVKVGSKSFEEAPKPVMNVLQRLSWAARQTIQDEPFTGFNEELIIGYFEDQKIDYHDDGEEQLGPTVASLSLGSTATMMFRMKKRYYHGKAKKESPYNHKEPVLKGCKAYDQRIRLNAKFHHSTKAEFDAAVKAHYQKFPVVGEAPVAIKMVLGHGDLVVMHGSEFQKYFEHSVVPKGTLRFALTCRFVCPNKIEPENRWRGDFVTNPEDLYDGDLDVAGSLTGDSVTFPSSQVGPSMNSPVAKVSSPNPLDGSLSVMNLTLVEAPATDVLFNTSATMVENGDGDDHGVHFPSEDLQDVSIPFSDALTLEKSN